MISKGWVLLLNTRQSQLKVKGFNPLSYGGGPIGPPLFWRLITQNIIYAKNPKKYVFLPKYVNNLFLISFSVSNDNLCLFKEIN